MMLNRLKESFFLASAIFALTLAGCGADALEGSLGPEEEDLATAGDLATAEQGLIPWTLVYKHDFADLQDVNAFQSGVAVNSALLPSDSTNDDLQKPTLNSNVAAVNDASALDGKAMAIYTRIANYETSSGTKLGWTNGRMMIEGQSYAPPVRIKTRLRMTASAKTKSAVMWWPSGGGWPWEVDFAETFGGDTTADFWGGRQHIGQRWHAEVSGVQKQLMHDDSVDATKYHEYDLYITAVSMWVKIDGVTKFDTADVKFIPDSAGHFSIGKALTHERSAAGRTNDTVFVDFVEIYKPAS